MEDVVAEESASDNASEGTAEEQPTVEDDEVLSDQEEELECRVCRGPAEHGRPLIGPCKCSGSIGLTHQDCLMSWLEVTRGDGRCELCKTKFRFDPQYAENTPDRLSPHEVVLGLTSRFMARWLPFSIRLLLVATVWLIVAPLMTSCWYHGWMHGASSVMARWNWKLIPGDIVSGVILASVIIISVLSLMSFADFLRVFWQQQPGAGGPNGAAAGQRNGHVRDGFEEEEEDETTLREGGVDMAIVDQMQQRSNSKKRKVREPSASDDDLTDLDGHLAEDASEAVFERKSERKKPPLAETDNVDANDTDNDEQRMAVDRMLEAMIQNEDDDSSVDSNEENEWNPVAGNPQPGDGNERLRVDADDPFDPIDAALQDDQGDMEINVALDDVLGIRGPIGTLIRNLLWLLSFNAIFLLLFAFVPRTIGSLVFSGFFNTTLNRRIAMSIPFVYSNTTTNNSTTVWGSIENINEESLTKDTTFRLPDLSMIVLGYLSIASFIVLLHYGWISAAKIGIRTDDADSNRGQQNPAVGQERRNQRARFDAAGINVHHDDIQAGKAISVALDAIVAIVKVGVLIFLKMFLLPIGLGLGLDYHTMPLFGHTMNDRTLFAGSDLFSFLLLHWVAGITSMLLVTVFLLQLREVAHPDLLARRIRPQEPHPDLLGNLMNETVGTHIRRIFLSLGIYAPLLTMHVSFPVKLLVWSGLTSQSSFFELNFCHILMPQLQVPLELVIFHLSMLALLERHKNTIGGLQHAWMVFMSRIMGLTEYMLPRSISGFELVGTKAIINKDAQNKQQVAPFWYDLAKMPKDVDSLMSSSIEPTSSSRFLTGESRENGEHVLSKEQNFIGLPPKEGTTEVVMLPTKIGRYRLQRTWGISHEEVPTIEVWREKPGREIRRPPAGWDDLGAGGAFVQGRWAWGKEKRSIVEGTVAKRKEFRESEQHSRSKSVMLKVCLLILLSWTATTVAILAFFSAPLAVGRSFYYLFRIPKGYVHDPLAFVIGGSILFPFLSLLGRKYRNRDSTVIQNARRWVAQFNLPSMRKLLVCTEFLVSIGFLAPLSLGMSYEIAVVKGASWFTDGIEQVNVKFIALSWSVGAVTLVAWAYLAYVAFFSKRFWMNVGFIEFPLEDNVAAAAQAAAVDRQAGGETPTPRSLSWQGASGRIARVTTIWKNIFLHCEWEKVDPTTMLKDFSRPITKQLVSTLLGSAVLFFVLINVAPLLLRFEQGLAIVPLLGKIDIDAFRILIFRGCMIAHVSSQLCSAHRVMFYGWCDAAHEAARDDRYLIGEILMSYEANSNRSNSVTAADDS